MSGRCDYCASAVDDPLVVGGRTRHDVYAFCDAACRIAHYTEQIVEERRQRFAIDDIADLLTTNGYVEVKVNP